MELAIVDLKQMIKDWRHHRFLKKHGCSTQREYDLKYDYDFNSRANYIKDIYQGYSYIIPITDYRHIIYNDYYKFYTTDYATYRDICAWCHTQCAGKWRCDWHRVGKDQFGYWINEISGTDYIFFAFKEPKDASLFTLKWL